MAQVVALVPGHGPDAAPPDAGRGLPALPHRRPRRPGRLLREIGGIPAQDVDVCLERWLADGLLEIVGDKSRVTPAGPERATAAPPPSADGRRQRTEGRWGPVRNRRESPRREPRHRLRRAAADPRVRGSRSSVPTTSCSAFRPGPTRRSSSGPTSSSRRSSTPIATSGATIGPYASRLDRIFKKIVEAYEMLSDPDRAGGELERSRRPSPKPST